MTLLESNVRSYCRSFPIELTKGKGTVVWDKNGDAYIDFLSGCGSLVYGHNNPNLKNALEEYISYDGISMSMDFESHSKKAFLESLEKNILAPRSMDYRVQFTGPTGANAIEAAIKLARKVTGRTNVIAFTNAFHGCSLGALSLTANKHHRGSSQSQLTNVSRLPYDGYFGESCDTAMQLEKMLDDPSGGCDAPAAIVLEVVQGEGGLNAASDKWLQKIARIAKKHKSLLIVDDIQAGCGRLGSFFSFENIKGFSPDIVTMAKGISGYGLPMSLVLLKPEWDKWLPGEHNGTFRGNNLAFVTAATALDAFWSTSAFQDDILQSSQIIKTELEKFTMEFGYLSKGRGLMTGIDFCTGELAGLVQRSCFDRGLIIETCGPYDNVLKLLPPLTVTHEEISQAFSIIHQSMRSVEVINSQQSKVA